MMPITTAEDLSEIYHMLVYHPRIARELCGLQIMHTSNGREKITGYYVERGITVAQFENVGGREIDVESWRDGRITTLWMTTERFDRIRSVNRQKKGTEKLFINKLSA